MSRHRLTTDELVQVYTLDQGGVSLHHISKQLGIDYHSVVNVRRRLDKYLTGKARTQQRISRNYKEAAKVIRKQHLDAQPIAATNSDRFTRLKQSFDLFQQSISAFIESDVEHRYTELLRENQRLREENEQLRKKSGSQTSLNWIDELQKTTQKETV